MVVAMKGTLFWYVRSCRLETASYNFTVLDRRSLVGRNLFTRQHGEIPTKKILRKIMFFLSFFFFFFFFFFIFFFSSSSSPLLLVFLLKRRSSFWILASNTIFLHFQRPLIIAFLFFTPLYLSRLQTSLSILYLVFLFSLLLPL